MLNINCALWRAGTLLNTCFISRRRSRRRKGKLEQSERHITLNLICKCVKKRRAGRAEKIASSIMHDGTQKVTRSAEICKNKKDFNVTALRDEKNL